MNKKYLNFILLIVGVILIYPTIVLAAGDPMCHQLEVKIFGSKVTQVCSPAAYIAPLFKLSLGAGVLLAFGAMTFAAVKYGSSRDNANQKKEAISQFGNSILGMVILFGITLALRTVNPALINLGGLQELGGEKIKMKDNKVCLSYVDKYNECSNTKYKTCFENCMKSLMVLINDKEKARQVCSSPGRYDLGIKTGGGCASECWDEYQAIQDCLDKVVPS